MNWDTERLEPLDPKLCLGYIMEEKVDIFINNIYSNNIESLGLKLYF